jgi:hypothetical protein
MGNPCPPQGNGLAEAERLFEELGNWAIAVRENYGDKKLEQFAREIECDEYIQSFILTFMPVSY